MPRWEEQVTNECSHEPGSDSHTVTAPACAAGTIPRIFPIPSGPRPPSPSALPLYPTYSHAPIQLPYFPTTLLLYLTLSLLTLKLPLLPSIVKCRSFRMCFINFYLSQPCVQKNNMLEYVS